MSEAKHTKQIWQTFTITITGQTGAWTIEAKGPTRDSLVPSQVFLWEPTPELQKVIDAWYSSEEAISDDALKNLGVALHRAVFALPGSIGKAFDAAKKYCMDNGEGLRLALRIDPSELASLPWEAMQDAEGLISTRPEIPLVRSFPGDELESMDVRGRLRVLFLSATPPTLEAVDVEHTLDLLEHDVLKDSGAGKRLKIEVINRVEPETLIARLGTRRNHVVLFAGHGESNEIITQDSTGVSAEKFAQALGYKKASNHAEKERTNGTQKEGPVTSAKGRVTNQQKPKAIPTRLVFLMACNTGSRSETDGSLAGFAETLARDTRVPAVVVMQTHIDDENAGTFTTAFFTALARFEPVDVAMAEARQSIEKVGRDAIAPVMYLQAQNAALFRKRLEWERWLLRALAMVLIILGVLVARSEYQRKVAEEAVKAKQLSAAIMEAIANLNVASEVVRGQISQADADLAKEGERQANEKAAEESQAANLERRKSQASEIAEKARIVFTNQPANPSLALLLAIEAAKVTWPRDRHISPDVVSTMIDLMATGQLPVRTVSLDHHSGKINSLEFSADSRMFVTASNDQTARIWDLTNGQQVASLLGHSDRVTYAEFSPNGMHVATASADGTVRIWTSETGQQVQLLSGHHGPVTTLAFSVDGNTLYSAGTDGEIIVWDVSSGNITGRHQFEDQYDDQFKVGIYTIRTLLPDELLIQGRRLEIWNTNSWKKLRSYPAYYANIWAKCQSTINRHQELIGLKQVEYLSETAGPSTSSYSVDAALIFDDRTGQPIFHYQSERGISIKCLSIDPDSQLIALTTSKGVRVSEISSGNQEYEIDDTHVEIGSFTPNGKYVVTVDNINYSIRVYNAADGSLISEIGSSKSAPLVRYSSDGMRVVTDSYPNIIRVWDVVENKELMQALGHAHGLDPTGNRIVVTDPNGISQVWDIQTGQVIMQLAEQPVYLHLFSHDGSILLTSDQDGLIRKWDTITGKEQKIVGQHEGGVNVMVWGSNEELLFTGGKDGIIHLWGIDSGRQSVAFDQHRDSIKYIAMGSDGQSIISADSSGVVYIWRLESGQILNTWTSQGNQIQAFNPTTEGALFLEVTSLKEAIVWSMDKDASTPVFRRTFSEMRDPKMYLSEQYLVVREPQSIVKVWDVLNGEELASIATTGLSLSNVAISPDHCCLMAGLTDGTARIWPLQSQFGERPKVFTESNALIRAAAFSPDGRQVAAGINNGFVVIWDRLTGRELFRLSQGKFLFDMGVDSANDLDNGIFSEDLKQLLADNGQETDSLWKQTVLMPGELWTVSNSTGMNNYLIRKEDQTLNVYKQPSIESLTYSPDGSLIATLAADSILTIWDVYSRTSLQTINLRKDSSDFDITEYEVVFSPDGLQIAAGIDQTPGVRIYNVGDGSYDRGFSNSVLSTFDPQESIVAVADHTSARLEDRKSGAVISTLEGDTKGIASIQFSPTGNHILAACGDGTVRLWNRFGREVLILRGHEQGTNSARFDSSGNYVVSASSDRTVRVWDAASGKEILRYDDFETSVSYAEFSVDGQWLLILTSGVVELRPATPDALIHVAEQLIQRDPPTMTAAERRQYGLD